VNARTSPRRRTRPAVARLAATALAATGLATALFVPAADAYRPEGDLEKAVTDTRSALPLEMQVANFAVQIGDGPDWLQGPDGTPDGKGAFAFYHGNVDIGAIYANRTLTGIDSYAVYGDILASWAANGYENSSFGYPAGMEHDARDFDQGCRSGDRAQRFQKEFEFGFLRRQSWACWNAASGVSWFSTEITR
jgi:hypothetical protein